MRILIAAVLLSCITFGANPGVSLAADNPYRTEQQAQNYLLTRVDDTPGGVAYCVGTPHPTRHRFQRFACVLTDFGRDRATALYLLTRPDGRWLIVR